MATMVTVAATASFLRESEGMRTFHTVYPAIPVLYIHLSQPAHSQDSDILVQLLRSHDLAPKIPIHPHLLVVPSRSTHDTSPPATMPQQRLVGIMRMIESQNVALLEHHALDEEYIRQSNTVLHNRRGKHRLENGQVPPSLVAFLDHIGHRRFVCFLFVQEPYSGHSLTLRRRVADDAFQQSVAVILVQNAKGGGLRSSAAQNSSNTSNSNDMENNSGAGSAAANLSPEARAYRNGTGFAVMRSSNILYTLLNVTYIPMIVVVDMRTGRPCSKDAGLALEWNTAGDVVRAWEKGRSGLTMAQKFLAVCTFQSECIIL